MAWLRSLQMHEVLVYGLALGLPVLVIGSQAVVAIVKAVIKHRERMAMIEQGLHPDLPREQSANNESPPPRSSQLDETQPYVPRR